MTSGDAGSSKRSADSSGSDDGGDGRDQARRRYRHKGPRRATGGTDISQGEPERLAGFGMASSGGLSASLPTRDGASRDKLDDRGRWILEQRPPHWG
ncbi:hypothetical protein [Kocuria massiliensis]|uniref:hypothetical protein n=1 Tax=Kocuria massiliensis TaxID=1926282 RepID=UPI000A1CEFBD|nr:hypothetical protein [Kocuria massiliensis]